MVVLDVRLLGLALGVLCGRAQGRRSAQAQPGPGLPQNFSKEQTPRTTAAGTASESLNCHGSKPLPAPGIVHPSLGHSQDPEGSPKRPVRPHMTGRGPGSLVPILLYCRDCLLAPTLCPRACSSTRKSSPEDLKVLSFFLTHKNVTGGQVEAPRALVMCSKSAASKRVHGEACACHHHPRGRGPGLTGTAPKGDHSPRLVHSPYLHPYTAHLAGLGPSCPLPSPCLQLQSGRARQPPR